MSEGNQKQPEDLKTVSLSNIDAFVSPNKMLVESAAMILSRAFMLFSLVTLVWGQNLSTTQAMLGVFGLIFTIGNVKQFASFQVMTGIACP